MFPVSFVIIVVGACFSFIAVVCLLILTSSSYRRRGRPTLTSGTRTVQSLSAGVLEPRLVAFTTASRDGANMSCRCTDDGIRQSAPHHEERHRRLTEHADPTSERVKSAYTLERQDDDQRSTPVCLDKRSLSDPVIVKPRTDQRETDRHHQNSAVLATSVVSTRADSGVSGMQCCSVCTLSSSATQTQQPAPELDIEGGEWTEPQSTDCLDATTDMSPVWNLSQLSMDVRSCPGDTTVTAGASLLPPLFLCQYVNGYSDAMLIHAADRQRRRALHSGDIDHAASTTASHCAADAEDQQKSRCRGDSVDKVPVSSGALTVQTKAIVEPCRTTSQHSATDSSCVCGQLHHLPDPDLPSPPSHIYDQSLDLPPSTTSARELQLPLHFLSPASSVCGQQQFGPPPHCTPDNQPLPTESLDAAVNVIKATPPTSPSQVERRRLLTRLVLGFHDELTLSPVYLEETYF